MDIKWLEWAKEIQGIAQTGLTYTKDVYDMERYEALRKLSVDILASYTEVGNEKIKLTFASDTGYATPKVDVRAVVFKDESILLVREKIDGAWALPADGRILGYPLEPYHCYKLFIQCEIVGGEALSEIETSAVAFFGIDQLPELSQERNTEAKIKTMFQYLDQLDKETILD